MNKIIRLSQLQPQMMEARLEALLREIILTEKRTSIMSTKPWIESLWNPQASDLKMGEVRGNYLRYLIPVYRVYRATPNPLPDPLIRPPPRPLLRLEVSKVMVSDHWKP